MENTNVIQTNVMPASHLNLAGVMLIPAVRQVISLLGVAVAVAAGFAIVLWSQTPVFTQLYGDLGSAESANVAEALRAADIKYKLNGDTGDIMVPESRLHDARLQLASQGIPESAAGGMSLMQDQSSFGVSQFMESARYQHALESELGRTIGSLGAVREARVHLALPKQTTFIRDQKSASASILLHLYRGRVLEQDQSSAIVHLVASSVPNLETKNITLIDQQGRLLSSGNQQPADAQAATQFSYARRLEDTYRQRIEELLMPLVGAGRVRAQVVADLDFTISEEARETYDPAKAVIRSEQINEQNRTVNDVAAAGIPGALSNQPPEAREESADAAGTAVSADQAEAKNTTRSSTRNYEVDRTISHTRPQAGTIKKLSVAVLIDDSPADADESESSLTEDDISRYTTLVQEAVGFSAARGDTVVVLGETFRKEIPPAAAEPPPLWEDPMLQGILKQVLGAVLVLAIVFGVVRPMLRGVLGSGNAASAEYLGSSPGYATSFGSGQLTGGHAAVAGPSYDEKIVAAKNITGHDPARVAQVVKKWVKVSE